MGEDLKITFCPPGPRPKEQKPVDVTWGEHGEVHSTGLSFDDTARMQVRRRPGWHPRVPDFALDDEKLRETICRAVEARAYGTKIFTRHGSQMQRMARAHQRLLEQAILIEKRLENLCHLFVARLKSGPMPLEERLRWEKQQQELDTRLMMVVRLPSIVGAVLYLSWRMGWDSVKVSSELGVVRPNTVRQILRRARLPAERIDHRPQKRKARGY
jgi:hypothetical protein